MIHVMPHNRFAAALPALFWNEEMGWIDVAVFRELEDKPALYKKAGMLSIPSESNEPEDRDVRDVFQRLLLEEYGLGPNRVSYVGREEPINGFPHGWPVFVGVTILNERIRFSPTDTDIEFAGWYPLHVFAQCIAKEGETRIETRDILIVALDLLEERGHELLGGAYA